MISYEYTVIVPFYIILEITDIENICKVLPVQGGSIARRKDNRT